MSSAFLAPTALPSHRASRPHLSQPKRAPVATARATRPSNRAAPRAGGALSALRARLISLKAQVLTLEQLTRPGATAGAEGESDRYEALPQSAKGPSQMLGRLSPGCEGTRGVFPRCNFACTPCYHSADANRVRVDGMHTVTEIARQMDLLRRARGSTGHCQLIGGEVSLLPPEDHALALETMRFFGRIPMSFTHGDFAYDYLERLAVREDGTKRFDRLDFAVHFDMEMRGRRGIERPRDEMELTPYRKRFVDMFESLRREHGVSYYLAHNMTVQETNLPYVAEAIREARAMGFRLLSFQPAAQQGAERRWVQNLRSVADDDGEIVWREIEKGMGIRLPYTLFQMGDVRCNRMTVCGILGPRGDQDAPIFPMFDDQCPHDTHARDLVFKHVGNIVLKPRVMILKLFRMFVARPWLLVPALRWCMRIVRRAGGLWMIMRRGVRPITIVMHRFMDAKEVSQAWDLMEHNVAIDDPRVEEAGPRIRETMERLAACSYGMAQPDQGRVVPACVQHSVYDPIENKELAHTLPLRQPAEPASQSQVKSLSDPQGANTEAPKVSVVHLAHENNDLNICSDGHATPQSAA